LDYTAAVYFALVNGCTNITYGAGLEKFYARLIELSELVPPVDDEINTEAEYRLTSAADASAAGGAGTATDAILAGEFAYNLLTGKKLPETLDIACFGDPTALAGNLSGTSGKTDELVWVPSAKWDLIPGYFVLHDIVLDKKSYKKVRVFDCSTSSATMYKNILSPISLAGLMPGETTIQVLGLLRKDVGGLVGTTIVGRTLSSSTLWKIQQKSGLDRWEYTTNLEFLKMATSRLIHS
jgi:hypothetical protein